MCTNNGCRLALGAAWDLPLCSGRSAHGQDGFAADARTSDTQELLWRRRRAAAASSQGVCASHPIIQSDLSLATLVANSSVGDVSVRVLTALVLQVGWCFLAPPRPCIPCPCTHMRCHAPRSLWNCAHPSLSLPSRPIVSACVLLYATQCPTK